MALNLTAYHSFESNRNA